jgi:hypothetical protein
MRTAGPDPAANSGRKERYPAASRQAKGPVQGCGDKGSMRMASAAAVRSSGERHS